MCVHDLQCKGDRLCHHVCISVSFSIPRIYLQISMFSQTVESYVFPQAIIQAHFYLHSSFMNLHGMLLNCRATCRVPCSSAE